MAKRWVRGLDIFDIKPNCAAITPSFSPFPAVLPSPCAPSFLHPATLSLPLPFSFPHLSSLHFPPFFSLFPLPSLLPLPLLTHSAPMQRATIQWPIQESKGFDCSWKEAGEATITCPLKGGGITLPPAPSVGDLFHSLPFPLHTG